jgi:hypothetical protein
MAGLPRPLIDVEVLLHLAVALGCRVVVDRAAPSIDGLLEDAAECQVQTALVVPAQARGMAQRVEACAPEGLVGVDATAREAWSSSSGTAAHAGHAVVAGRRPG